ncbi:hypothetical protein [Methylobacterium sp. J-076]|uniref:hypothetical protein n=1 Tax=Methylobacterium sp. J-076 TaxID=2836655 RepID=UPI001FBBFFFD|nr:hypothetical protein [Methylobacterium sp. J-076]MCJ2012566.1 hypothetical protein [Methylobacterium sp. J-076]
MRNVAPALALLLLASPALAAGGETELTGEATLGGEARHVTLRLACDPAHAGLSAALTVPRYADLAPRFDFHAFEGPDGTGKPLTALRVSGGSGVRSVIAPASGAVAADPATSFVLTVAGPRRSENPLRSIAADLARPDARITWAQASPRPGDAPLTATFRIEEAGPLRTALEPCFGP